MTDYCVIYLNNDQSLWVAVDPVDYEWARQYRWNYKPDRTFFGDHYYAKRNIGPLRTAFYLHRAILARVKPQPADHPVGDHIDGNTLDCRRKNLRWATLSMNRCNRRCIKSFLLPIPQPVELNIPF